MFTCLCDQDALSTKRLWQTEKLKFIQRDVPLGDVWELSKFQLRSEVWLPRVEENQSLGKKISLCSISSLIVKLLT